MDKSVAKGHDLYFGAFCDPTIMLRDDSELRHKLNTLNDERSKLVNPQLIAQKDAEIQSVYRQMQAANAEAQRQIGALYNERSKLKDPHLIAQKDAEIRRAYDEMLAPVRAKSRALLEQQVKDFIDWLKGQGVI